MLDLIAKINSLFWGSILIILLVGTGIFFTIRLKFVQIRKFKRGLKQLTGDFNLNGKAADHNGMSSFQALATAIAAQVGTGNLAGAATAIVSGGPGAIFWMWVSAFFGMATIYAEAILSQIFKRKVEGAVTGGPAYYIEELFNKSFISKILAVFFALSCVLALGFMGNAVQANSIGVAFENSFNIPTYITGIFVALLSGYVFFGGVQRVAAVTEKVVPLMAGLYIIICTIIIGLNYDLILKAFEAIFVNAFSSNAILGGLAGTGIKKAIRYGVARGLFSNEAGMGSTPHAHAVAKVKNPVEQGNVAIITVFIDTFIVLTLTALVILTSKIDFTGITGITLAQKAFENSLGAIGSIFIAVSLFFFAFSTIVGWYFFGEANIKYLFGNNALNIYRLLVMICITVGSLQKVELVWELADMFNGFMVIPNLIALIVLNKLVVKTSEEYELAE
ncbi:MAG: sodium:alanine symporter family protein [Fusobacterium gastrosuis]|uniref:alanine/glycine:cation symporter family protein n=2 Tax=Fusobacterium TaxID=848 RepID=UPI0025F63B91|nr:sodium:alanine symporter family protein [uncultured Fusobacterium sp.]MDD7391456.1 sodium:alanine symporter family protein [Fusobacteriaceae bacterium]MDD7410886.1 sodium:alanine symporter family protein [Fusobacteriaceae bacterium]MDY4010239.1 sodium:alanine symporter family protein [Fusobacterium gastrosuis]MDY5713239.1 sodium:alanine symporter family protein [Fusobacterium gastrosuis]